MSSSSYLVEPCNAVTVFELVSDAITFYPGQLFQEDLHDSVAANAVEMLNEALLCFYGSSYRGVVTFCRSAAEEVLVAQDVQGKDLDAKIKKAGDYLDPEERALANAARITGRNAIHRLAVVSAANALGALTNSTDFLNSVSEKDMFPAWQSKQDNNAS
jgi:hypothetical protein